MSFPRTSRPGLLHLVDSSSLPQASSPDLDDSIYERLENVARHSDGVTMVVPWSRVQRAVSTVFSAASSPTHHCVSLIEVPEGWEINIAVGVNTAHSVITTARTLSAALREEWNRWARDVNMDTPVVQTHVHIVSMAENGHFSTQKTHDFVSTI